LFDGAFHDRVVKVGGIRIDAFGAPLTVMTVETFQIMKVMTVFPSSPTLLPQGEKRAS
jgi:hypothetical protein